MGGEDLKVSSTLLLPVSDSGRLSTHLGRMETALVKRGDTQSSSCSSTEDRRGQPNARPGTKRRREGEGGGGELENEKLVVSCCTHSPLNFSMSSFSARVSFVEVDSDDAKEERSIRGGM